MEFLPFIIDILMIIIIIGSFFDGRRRGFVKTVLSIVATLIAVFFAYEYAQPVAAWFNDAFVHQRVAKSIANVITENIANGTQAVTDALPNYIIRAAEAAGISAGELISSAGAGIDAAKIGEQLCSALEGVFILPAIKAVAFFVIFAVCSGILAIVIAVIDSIFKLPVIKSLNKLLGGVLGAVKGLIGVLIVSVVFCGISELFPETQFAQAVTQAFIPQSVWNILNLIIFE